MLNLVKHTLRRDNDGGVTEEHKVLDKGKQIERDVIEAFQLGDLREELPSAMSGNTLY